MAPSELTVKQKAIQANLIEGFPITLLFLGYFANDLHHGLS